MTDRTSNLNLNQFWRRTRQLLAAGWKIDIHARPMAVDGIILNPSWFATITKDTRRYTGISHTAWDALADAIMDQTSHAIAHQIFGKKNGRMVFRAKPKRGKRSPKIVDTHVQDGI